MKDELIKQVLACKLCESKLPLAPKPIVQFHPNAKIQIIGQAPGHETHKQSLPFKDKSGDRLREWLGVTEEEFYHPELFAITPMAFCFPGKLNNGSGDKAPPAICAKTWHQPLQQSLINKQLTIYIGRHAANYYLPEIKSLNQAIQTLTDKKGDEYLLPHPSPRNNIWLNQHPWFQTNTLPHLRQRIRQIIRREI